MSEQFLWQGLLLKEVSEWSEKIKEIGIPVGNVRDISINKRARKRWGQCVKMPDGTFSLNFSERLFHKDVPESARASVICHELLHTAKGCIGHGCRWKGYAYLVRKKYGVIIKTTVSAEELGVPWKYMNKDPKKYRYKIICEKCGAIIYRERISALVKYPERYIHTGCGGHFKRIKG